MFGQSITSTPFTNEQASAFFQNINGQLFGADCSMIATLRALVSTKMGGDDRIRVAHRSIAYTVDDLGTMRDKDIANQLIDGTLMTSGGNLIIYSLNADHDNNVAVMDKICKGVAEAFPGFHRLESINAFYRKSFAVDCFINPETKTTLLLVDFLNNRKFHYLQVSILAFMPWYLDKEKGMTDEEMALIYSLRETTQDKYQQCLDAMVEKYDFRSARIRQLLDGFEIKYERIVLEDVQRQINNTDIEIASYNEQIGEMLRRRHDLCIQQMGLERKIEEGAEESEIMDYFMTGRHVVLEHVGDSDMRFGVKTYLEYFDPDLAEIVIRNRNSHIYSRRTGEKADKMERLMREVFLSDSPRIRIRICAAYKIALHGSVAGISHFNFGSEYNGYIPNMHIQQHACMSTYQSEVNNFLARHDYIGAIEQCVASAKSLNFGDGTVLNEFISALWNDYYTAKKCFELPDGSVVSTSEAFEWLDSQEGKKSGKKKKEEAAENE